VSEKQVIGHGAEPGERRRAIRSATDQVIEPRHDEVATRECDNCRLVAEQSAIPLLIYPRQRAAIDVAPILPVAKDGELGDVWDERQKAIEHPKIAGAINGVTRHNDQMGLKLGHGVGDAFFVRSDGPQMQITELRHSKWYGAGGASNAMTRNGNAPGLDRERICRGGGGGDTRGAGEPLPARHFWRATRRH
jgi:hypothetical protein